MGSARLCSIPVRCLHAEQRVQSDTVEADHHLAVNHRDWRSEHAQLLQLGQRSLVLCHITLDKRHPSLGKKLFHPFAEDSGALGIDGHFLEHRACTPALVTYPLRSTPLSSRALKATMTVLALMVSAPHSGRSVMPHGCSTPAATGIAIRL